MTGAAVVLAAAIFLSYRLDRPLLQISMQLSLPEKVTANHTKTIISLDRDSR